MRQRRAVSTIVTALIAAVAILGTTVFFTSGNVLLPQETDELTQAERIQTSENTQPPVFTSASIQIQNAHVWVSSSGQTVTAFVVKNTGGAATSISGIAVKGLSVPQASWYSCDPASCGTVANTNTVLSVDFVPENGVNLASGLTAFTSGAISLGSGQSTVVYLPEAGSLQVADAGLSFTLNVQAGKASAVQSVTVVLQDDSSPAQISTARIGVSDPTWRWIGNEVSTFKVTVRNVGDTVIHIEGVKIGDERYGTPILLDYHATVQPGQSHLVTIDTTGIAKAEMLGLAYTYTVITTEGTNPIGSVPFLMNS
ncbi:MAG: hypothetical protein ACREBU_04930 [Nitrososphaera sp.]